MDIGPCTGTCAGPGHRPSTGTCIDPQIWTIYWNMYGSPDMDHLLEHVQVPDIDQGQEHEVCVEDLDRLDLLFFTPKIFKVLEPN